MQRDRTPLSDRARGRWKGVLPQLGVPGSALTGNHGPCPMCGGRDRFRFDDADGSGSWICSQGCGAGYGVHLVMKVNGWGFADAAKRIEALIDRVEPEQSKPTRKTSADALNALWRASAPIRHDNAAGRWLIRRVGAATPNPALRFVERLQHNDAGVKTFHPGMIARVSDAAGQPVTLHRTYLTPDGRKAAVASPRKLMPGGMPKGGAIRLTPAAETLGVAEGVETALAVAALFGVPCWSTVNSSLLEAWSPPAGTRSVIVFGDNDPKYGGQAAAYALAHRLACDDRLGVKAEVRLPHEEGDDWNDVLLKRRAAA